MNRSVLSGGGGPQALPLVFFPLLLFFFAAGSLNPATAQTIQGQLLDRSTQLPIEGALAILLDAQGKEVRGVLTSPTGRFLIRAPGTGAYTVRTDRIGYASVTSESFTLEAGQRFVLRLETETSAIQLEELRVEGEQQCVVRPEEGLEVARVWEEARKALAVQEWTEREGLYRFQVVEYERDLDPGARIIRSEDRRVTTSMSRSPIRSLPAEELMENGFIRQNRDGSLEYFGPDATVLLSDVFLDTHCFRLTTDTDHPASVGLAFEPVRRGEIRDLVGTLWLDRESGALRYLEYGYTWAQYQEAQGVARGRVEFEGLPNGSWIVRKWWIRMPRLAQDLARAGGGRSGVYLAGIREAGGEIAQISTMDRQRIAQTPGGILSGLVWDSTRQVPLSEAQIFLSGTSHVGVSDDEGRFHIEGIPEGVFTATFLHPRLDTLGARAPGVEVEITPGGTTDVQLGVPSARSIFLAACRDEERPQGSAGISGVVRARGSGEPIPGATVRLDWQEVSRIGQGRLSGQAKWIEIDTDPEGRFRLCSVPGNELITLQATFLDRKGEPVQITVLEESFTVVDLVVEVRGPRDANPNGRVPFR